MSATSKIRWDDVTLEKEIPIPELPRKISSSTVKLEQMELNDSFTMPKKFHPNLNSAIAKFKKTHKGMKFVTRAVEDDLVRCWRVK